MDKDPWWIRYLTSILTRVIYFVGAFVICFFGGLYESPASVSDNWLVFLGICVRAGLLSAIIGPYVYQPESERGRGTLDEVRRKSRRIKP